MTKSCLILAASALLVAGVTGQAAAQGGFTVNPYVGVLIADDGGLNDAAEGLGGEVSIDPALLAGARVGFTTGSNLGFEAGYGYSPLKVDFSESGDAFELDTKAHLFYGAVNYTFPSESQAKFFISAGAGGIMIKADDETLFEGAESSSTDLLVNLGGGLLWSVNDRWAIRVDAKDHIEFCKAAETVDDFSACPLDDKALNHIEVSGGVSIQLGGSSM
jgi:hypothetical protein